MNGVGIVVTQLVDYLLDSVMVTSGQIFADGVFQSVQG